jgi:Prohead core protein serine protease
MTKQLLMGDGGGRAAVLDGAPPSAYGLVVAQRPRVELREIFVVDPRNLNESSAKIRKISESPLRYEVTCLGQQCGVVNRNKRRYRTESTWGPHLRPGADFISKIHRRRVCGHIEHPETGRGDLKLDAIGITDATYPDDKGKIFTTFETLSTPDGLIVASHIHDGFGFGISSRAEGSVIRDSEGVDEVQPDFQPYTWDVVCDESVIGAEILIGKIAEGHKRLLESVGGDPQKLAELAQVLNLQACKRDKMNEETPELPTGFSQFLLSAPDGAGDYRAFDNGKGQWDVWLQIHNLKPLEVANGLQTLKDAKLAAESHFRWHNDRGMEQAGGGSLPPQDLRPAPVEVSTPPASGETASGAKVVINVAEAVSTAMKLLRCPAQEGTMPREAINTMPGDMDGPTTSMPQENGAQGPLPNTPSSMSGATAMEDDDFEFDDDDFGGGDEDDHITIVNVFPSGAELEADEIPMGEMEPVPTTSQAPMPEMGGDEPMGIPPRGEDGGIDNPMGVPTGAQGEGGVSGFGGNGGYDTSGIPAEVMDAPPGSMEADDDIMHAEAGTAVPPGGEEPMGEYVEMMKAMEKRMRRMEQLMAGDARAHGSPGSAGIGQRGTAGGGALEMMQRMEKRMGRLEQLMAGDARAHGIPGAAGIGQRGTSGGGSMNEAGSGYGTPELMDDPEDLDLNLDMIDAPDMNKLDSTPVTNNVDSWVKMYMENARAYMKKAQQLHEEADKEDDKEKKEKKKKHETVLRRHAAAFLALAEKKKSEGEEKDAEKKEKKKHEAHLRERNGSPSDGCIRCLSLVERKKHEEEDERKKKAEKRKKNESKDDEEERKKKEKKKHEQYQAALRALVEADKEDDDEKKEKKKHEARAVLRALMETDKEDDKDDKEKKEKRKKHEATHYAQAPRPAIDGKVPDGHVKVWLDQNENLVRVEEFDASSKLIKIIEAEDKDDKKKDDDEKKKKHEGTESKPTDPSKILELAKKHGGLLIRRDDECLCFKFSSPDKLLDFGDEVAEKYGSYMEQNIATEVRVSLTHVLSEAGKDDDDDEKKEKRKHEATHPKHVANCFLCEKKKHEKDDKDEKKKAEKKKNEAKEADDEKKKAEKRKKQTEAVTTAFAILRTDRDRETPEDGRARIPQNEGELRKKNRSLVEEVAKLETEKKGLAELVETLSKRSTATAPATDAPKLVEARLAEILTANPALTPLKSRLARCATVADLDAQAGIFTSAINEGVQRAPTAPPATPKPAPQGAPAPATPAPAAAPAAPKASSTSVSSATTPDAPTGSLAEAAGDNTLLTEESSSASGDTAGRTASYRRSKQQLAESRAARLGK